RRHLGVAGDIQRVRCHLQEKLPLPPPPPSPPLRDGGTLTHLHVVAVNGAGGLQEAVVRVVLLPQEPLHPVLGLGREAIHVPIAEGVNEVAAVATVPAEVEPVRLASTSGDGG